jgi:hypothetical protein
MKNVVKTQLRYAKNVFTSWDWTLGTAVCISFLILVNLLMLGSVYMVIVCMGILLGSTIKGVAVGIGIAALSIFLHKTFWVEDEKDEKGTEI